MYCHTVMEIYNYELFSQLYSELVLKSRLNNNFT